MILTKILGGLGNQMFQYAMGRNLSILHKTEMKFETLGLEAGEDVRSEFCLDVFNLPEISFATKKEKLKFERQTLYRSTLLNHIVNVFNSRVMIREQGHFPFNKAFVTKSKKNTYIRGLWQSERYFIDNEVIIRKDFSFKKPLEGKNLELSNVLKSSDNSISIHVRRGDYVNNAHFSEKIGTCDMDYYIKAIAYMGEHIDQPQYFVFSDDIEWAKENLPLNTNSIFVDHNTLSNSYIDMQLMSLCKHHIIANSTFSWWGAWLNNNKDKIVIAPEKWFAGWDYDTKDLIPKKWIKL